MGFEFNRSASSDALQPVTLFEVLNRSSAAAQEVVRRTDRVARSGDSDSDDAVPGFGHGTLLDGLALMRPSLELSTCEWMVSMFGVEPPAQFAVDAEFTDLLNACKGMPAQVDQCQWLQDRIDTLRQRVVALSRRHVGLHQRDEVAGQIADLWIEVYALHKKIDTERARRQRTAGSARLQGAAPRMATGAGQPWQAHAVRRGEPEAVLPADGPVSSQRAGLKRRTRADGAATGQASGAAATPVEPYRLSDAQRDAVQQTLARAWPHRDGAGRVPDFLNLQLGSALTGAVNGSYPAHVGHQGHRQRRFTVEQVVERATEYMTPWHADALRAWAYECIGDLQRG